jgi:flagellar protein FlaF
MHESYQRAAAAYAHSSRMATDQRQIEANALLKAARQLEDVRGRWTPELSAELDGALLFNRKLWAIFAAEAADGAQRLPAALRANIANIALFVFRRTMDLQVRPEAPKIDALIEINRTIAAGLMTRPGQTAGAADQAAAFA